MGGGASRRRKGQEEEGEGDCGASRRAEIVESREQLFGVCMSATHELLSGKPIQNVQLTIII